jgi:hypothetical protein
MHFARGLAETSKLVVERDAQSVLATEPLNGHCVLRLFMLIVIAHVFNEVLSWDLLLLSGCQGCDDT